MIANFIQLKILLSLFIFACSFMPQTGFAQAGQSPIFVELFTSSGCPACPPADRNLSTLINQSSDIIGVSCHVTYFDRGNRRDPLSKPFCDARQNVYKLALKTGGIFTPMTIIQGKAYTTGKDLNDVKSIINQNISINYSPVSLQQNGQYLDIRLPSMPLQNPADIWLFELKKHDGRFQNSVTNITKLLRWSGQKLNMAFPVKPQNPNTAYALVVQDYKTGIITSAKAR
ncbi:MAG: DUF1223 domain-containing protein [Pseudomonadota bacterium]